MVKKSIETETPQVQIRLTTKQQHYAVPDYPLSVAVTIVNSELNDIVNQLLKESDDSSTKTIEFDFLINSEFIRTNLSEHLSEREISSEEVIDIEYIEKYPPPEPQDCLIHDDWVSAVAVKEKWILTGCYDNSLHLWTSKGKHHLSIPGHKKPIKAVDWVSLDSENGVFVSASQDQTIRIYNWNIENNSVKCLYECKGHSRELECVSVNSSSNLMASGSWDKMIKIWSTSLQDKTEDGESMPKVSKTDGSKVRVPERTMKGHEDAISSILWSEKSEIITSSWDHYIKIWDAELGAPKHEILGNKVFLDIDFSPLSKTIVAASIDTIIRLYDPRSKEGSVIKAKFVSHTEGVKCVRWSTTNEHLFISGAQDKILKLWDARSPKVPLFDLTGHEEQILCCNWSNPKIMVSGGSDKTVRIYKSNYTN